MFMVLFVIFSLINLIQSLKSEYIYPFSEKNFSLTNTNLYKIYILYPKITDLNNEIYFQITSNSNGKAKLCVSYFQNEIKENINYNPFTNEFINCQKIFNIESIGKVEEYNITYNFNSTNYLSPNANGFYSIGLYIDKKSSNEFSGTITVIITNKMIQIDKDILSKYLFFKNNYLSKNYSFIIYPNKSIKKNLHIQIETLNNKNSFNLGVIKDNDNFMMEEKLNISSYNNFLDVSNEGNFYILNISFLEDNINLNNNDFAIYFEYSSFNNNIMPLTSNVIEANFLTKSDYYFYHDIKESNSSDKFFYLANDFTQKRGAIALSFLDIDIKLNDVNDINIKNQIYLSNFSNCKSRFNGNSLTVFKCTKNGINLKNNSNILILKLSSTGFNSLKIRTIHFKEFKKIVINDNINELFYQSFNSELLIDKVGYFYIPKLNNNTKRQIIYCSKDNSMTVYNGDYDLIDQNLEIRYDKIRMFKISHNNEDYSGNNFNGLTIITNNKVDNYFIQITDIDKDIYDNLLIEKISDKLQVNREIKFNIPIKNYYIFYQNDFTEDYLNIIFDIVMIYGNLDIKYIDIDSISVKDFNLKKVLSFNQEDYSIIDLNHPTLVKKTTEFIKIINNNYNSKYYFKAKFYLNKYFLEENKIWNSLIPIYLNPLESKKYSLDNLYGNTSYMFKLGNKYNDNPNNKNDSVVKIIIGNYLVYNIFNLTNSNNFIKGNIHISFGDTIQIINNYNQSILFWSNFGFDESEQKNINSLYLSQNFYYLYTFSRVHKLCFDWFNIKKKLNTGLIPQKIMISLLNEKQMKTNGYYYQIINKEDDNNNFLYYNSYINSIYYELEQGQSQVFLSEDINITIFNYYYKDNSYINYIIYPSSGLSTILFYVEYSYDITNYLNILKYLEFDDSVYSLNLKLDDYYIKKGNINDYIFFQCLSCSLIQSTVSFKYNNNSFNQDAYNENDIIIKSISTGNIIGYMNLKLLDKNNENVNFYVNILKPYNFHFIYYYTSKIKNDYIFQTNYNINVEKYQNSNAFVVSFDCFLKNIKTNYTILIIDNKQKNNEITNECEFLAYIEKNIDIKYMSFVDNNENIRIKKEISFDKFGNYGIYILAKSLDSLPIYKYLGTESYSFTSDFFHNSNIVNTNNNNYRKIIVILIFIILLIILIILFVVFHYVRKRKLIKLFNILNNSLLSDEHNSSDLVEFNHVNDSSDISSFELKSKSLNENDNSFLLFDKPQLEEEDKNKYANNDNNIKENKNDTELDIDPRLLGQSPAPLFGSTFCSEEDRIKDELSKINDSTYNPNINKDEEKTYVNTNKGKD